MIETLDRLRHLIPFWWWLTYDALVLVVIVVGVEPWSPAFWLGVGTLFIAVVIDTAEFLVKRPSARARLAANLPSSGGPVKVVFAADSSKARVQLQYAEARAQLFSARCAFADALIALEELGHGDRAEAIQARWRDVEVAGLVGREAG